jgi:hypothetical protein
MPAIVFGSIEEVELRQFILVVVIGLALGYVADTYWYNGRYFAALSGMISEMIHNFQ